jgi:hypothetical protein
MDRQAIKFHKGMEFGDWHVVGYNPLVRDIGGVSGGYVRLKNIFSGKVIEISYKGDREVWESIVEGKRIIDHDLMRVTNKVLGYMGEMVDSSVMPFAASLASRIACDMIASRLACEECSYLPGDKGTVAMSSRRNLISSRVLADTKYEYDPEHKHKPEGPGWKETGHGWSTNKEDSGVGESGGSHVEQNHEEEKPKVVQHLKDEELSHRVKLKKEDLKKTLDDGHYSILSAGRNYRDEKESKMQPTDSYFHDRTLALRDDLEKSGVKYTEVVGVYDSLEPSFMVLHNYEKDFDEKTARNYMVHHNGVNDKHVMKTVNRLGQKYNQDSVLHSLKGRNTMVFTTGEHRGKHCSGKGWKETPDADNFYTDIPVKDTENTKVSLDIDECFKRKLLASELRRVKRLLAKDKSPYRHDPNHDNRPPGSYWVETDKGWSQSDYLSDFD